MPTTSDKFSKSPPQTAPSILAASAELGESVIRNSSANKSPAKKTGIAKVKATAEPTYLVEPEMLLKGIKYAMSKLPRSTITEQGHREIGTGNPAPFLVQVRPIIGRDGHWRR